MFIRIIVFLFILNLFHVQSQLLQSPQLTVSNKHTAPIIDMKVSLDQTRLFSWDTDGNLKVWLKDRDKLTYKQTINFNPALPSGVNTADFIYITDDGQKIYTSDSSYYIQIYEYKGATNDPLYQVISITAPSASDMVLSIVANKQGTIMFLGQQNQIQVFQLQSNAWGTSVIKSLTSVFVTRLSLIDNQLRLLTVQYSQTSTPLMLVYDVSDLTSFDTAGEITDASLIPLQLVNSNTSPQSGSIWKFKNTIYMFGTFDYQTAKQFYLAPPGDPFQYFVWGQQNNILNIVSQGVVTFNGQVYGTNLKAPNVLDEITAQKLLKEFVKLIGGSLPTSVIFFDNNNFYLATSDGGIYSIAYDPSAVTSNCQNFTVVSNNAVRCDVCKTEYVLVVINEADMRACCKRIDNCKQYNKNNCLCKTCRDDFLLSFGNTNCRKINSDQKCMEYDFSKNVCKKCGTGYVPDKDGTCSLKKECEIGQYKNSSGVCNPGNKPNCLEYESPTGDCIKCYKDYKFNQLAQCIQKPDINKDIKCPENTLQTTFYKQNGKCKSRGVSCAQANDDGTCKYCVSDSFYLHKGVCIPVVYPKQSEGSNIRRNNI